MVGLSSSERLEIYDGIVNYGLNDEEPVFKTTAARMVFQFIRSEIDAEAKHKNAISKARSRAGKLGGAPKNNANASKAKSETQPQPPTATNSPPQAPMQTDEIIEDAVIIEEIAETPSNGASTENTLFGDMPISSKPQTKPTAKKRPQKPAKHHYAPEVLLTEEEYEKLVSKYGKEATAWMIEKLDNYKAARGMTYKSDYRAILNWVVAEYQKQVNQFNNGRASTNFQYNQNSAKQQRDIEFASYIADVISSDSSQGAV